MIQKEQTLKLEMDVNTGVVTEQKPLTTKQTLLTETFVVEGKMETKETTLPMTLKQTLKRMEKNAPIPTAAIYALKRRGVAQWTNHLGWQIEMRVEEVMSEARIS